MSIYFKVLDTQLIIFFLMAKSFALLLISGGATAATGFMLNDSKKMISQCQSKNSNRFENEKEISELRNVIINNANIENVLNFIREEPENV